MMTAAETTSWPEAAIAIFGIVIVTTVATVVICSRPARSRGLPLACRSRRP